MTHLVNMLLLLLAPEKFISRATTHAIASSFRSDAQLRLKYPDERLPEDVRRNYEDAMRKRASTFRRAVLTGIGVTLGAMICGIIVGLVIRSLVGPPSKIAVYVLQALGAAIILGATLAEASRKIDTIDGESLPEEVNAFMFRALYVVGTFLFVVSVSWDAT